ncbi:hypothetical protein AB0C18_42710 [Nonomuraea muscovyensis]|uniref:hypothetical protein n=1 Tax=Nonomuraea muscovyensis TaxID=1124761 RepID=UPI0033FC302A
MLVTNRATADRYRRPIAPPDNCLILCPVVVGPDELPILREREDVLSSPEIATLSAIAHQDDFDTVVSVATALATFDDDRSLVYYDYLRGQLSEELRAKLEDIMIETAPRLPDRFTLPIEQEAEARGETRGEAKALLTLLAARNLTLTPDLRETVESCTDEEVLLRWTTRAATASSAHEVFGEG